MLAHADDLGGDKRQRALVLFTERGNHVRVARNQHLQLLVLLKRLGNTLEHDLGTAIASHGVYADGNHVTSLTWKRSTLTGRPPIHSYERCVNR